VPEAPPNEGRSHLPRPRHGSPDAARCICEPDAFDDPHRRTTVDLFSLEEEKSGEAMAHFAAGPKRCPGLRAERGRDRPIHNPLFSNSLGQQTARSEKC